MYIKHKPIAAFYKLALGTLALAMQWLLMGQYGLAALGLFATWALFIAAVYFLSSALILALSHSHESGKNPCPMLEGMIIMAFLLITVISCMRGGAAASNFEQANPLANFAICWILPVLTILDWALFVKKGRWRAMAPFYWLALPVCYGAAMSLVAGITSDAVLRLTLADLHAMLISFLIFVAIELAVGYGFYLLDFALSGKLAKKIVLPHLQTVIVDAEGREISREPTAEDFMDTSSSEEETAEDLVREDANVDLDEDATREAQTSTSRPLIQKQKSEKSSKSAQKTIIIEKINEPEEPQKPRKPQPKNSHNAPKSQNPHNSQKSRNKSKHHHNHKTSKKLPK